VRFGKIGSAGQKKPKKLASPDAAQKEMEKLIREKTGKGYEEVKLKGLKPLKAVDSDDDDGGDDDGGGGGGGGSGGPPWGNEDLRKAAFRALRRAQRTNTRRANAPKWFTPDQLVQLASNPELAESMMPAAPAKPARGGGDDDDEGDDEDYDDEDEGDDDE
jgi:hypothetical protein